MRSSSTGGRGVDVGSDPVQGRAAQSAKRRSENTRRSE